MKKTTVIRNAKIYTVDKNFECISNGTIVFDESSILAVGNDSDISIPDAAEIIDAKGRYAILPGLIDSHSHSSLLKGFSENAQLMDWLPEYQREHQALNEQDAFYSYLVNFLEAVKGGTTAVMDMYRFGHMGVKAAELIGLRVHLVPYAADHPTKHFFETIETNEALIADYHNALNGKIKTWVGLEHITYCSKEMFAKSVALSERYGVNIHTHTSEQREEVEHVREAFGARPAELFADWGILKPGSVLAHCVWLDEDEQNILAKTGTGIAHCPISNMKLASGSAPLESFLEKGITVGLGSDGGVSNNSVSMFECMKYASLLQKVSKLDAVSVNAEQALRLATIEGAKLLGIDHEVGSLEVGKQADIIAIDLWQPHLLPIIDAEGHDPVLWNLVFASRASDVKYSWVQGEKIIDDFKFAKLDENALLQEIHNQTQSLLARRKHFKGVPMV